MHLKVPWTILYSSPKGKNVQGTKICKKISFINHILKTYHRVKKKVVLENSNSKKWLQWTIMSLKNSERNNISYYKSFVSEHTSATGTAFHLQLLPRKQKLPFSKWRCTDRLAGDTGVGGGHYSDRTTSRSLHKTKYRNPSNYQGHWEIDLQ